LSGQTVVTYNDLGLNQVINKQVISDIAYDSEDRVASQTIATFADDSDQNLINVQEISNITYDSQDMISSQDIITRSRSEVLERLSISNMTYDSEDRISGQIVQYKTLDNSTASAGSDIIFIEEMSGITYDNQDRMNAQTIVTKDARGNIYQTRQMSNVLYDNFDRIKSHHNVVSMDSQIIYKQQVNNITYDNLGLLLSSETLTYNKNDKLIRREELLIVSRDINHMESGQEVREYTAQGVLKETRKISIAYDQDTLRAKKTTTQFWKQNTLIRTEELVINKWDPATGDITDQTTTIREDSLVTTQHMYGIVRDAFRQITAYQMDIAETAGNYTKTTHTRRFGIKYYLGNVSEYRETITSSLNGITTNVHAYDMVYDLDGDTAPSAFKKTITESGAGYSNTTQISRTATTYNDMGQATGYTETVSNLGVTTVSVYSGITYDLHERMLTFRIDARANGHEIPAVARTSTTYDSYGMLVAYSETRYGISCADMLGFDTAGAYTTSSWSGVYQNHIGNLKSYKVDSTNTARDTDTVRGRSYDSPKATLEHTYTEVEIKSRNSLGFVLSETSKVVGPGEDKDGKKVTETTTATTTYTYDANGRVSGKKTESSSSNSKDESSTSYTETTITYSADGTSVATSNSVTNSSDGGQSKTTSTTTTYIDGSMLVTTKTSGTKGDGQNNEDDFDDDTGRRIRKGKPQPPTPTPDDLEDDDPRRHGRVPKEEGEYEEPDPNAYTSGSTQKYDCLGTKRYYHSESQSTDGSSQAPYTVTETWDKFGNSLGKDESGNGGGGGGGGGGRRNTQDYEDYLEAAQRAGFEEKDLENLSEVDRLAIEFLMEDLELERDQAYEKAQALLDKLEEEGKSLDELSGEERWAFQLWANGSVTSYEKAIEYIEALKNILKENNIDPKDATSDQYWAAQSVKNGQSSTWDEAQKWINAYNDALALQGTETAPVTKDNATKVQRLIAEIAADIMCDGKTISPVLAKAVDAAKKKVSDIEKMLRQFFRTEKGVPSTIATATDDQLSQATHMADQNWDYKAAKSYLEELKNQKAAMQLLAIPEGNLTDYQRRLLTYAINDEEFMSMVQANRDILFNPNTDPKLTAKKQELMNKAAEWVFAIRSYGVEEGKLADHPDKNKFEKAAELYATGSCETPAIALMLIQVAIDYLGFGTTSPDAVQMLALEYAMDDANFMRLISVAENLQDKQAIKSAVESIQNKAKRYVSTLTELGTNLTNATTKQRFIAQLYAAEKFDTVAKATEWVEKYEKVIIAGGKTLDNLTDEDILLQTAAELYANDTKGKFKNPDAAIEYAKVYVANQAVRAQIAAKLEFKGVLDDKQKAVISYIMSNEELKAKLLSDKGESPEIRDQILAKANPWAERFIDAFTTLGTTYDGANSKEIFIAQRYADGNYETVKDAELWVEKYMEVIALEGKTLDDLTDKDVLLQTAAENYADDIENKYLTPQDALDAVYEYLASQAGYSGNTSEAFNDLSNRLDSIPLYGPEPDIKRIMSEAGLKMVNDVYLQTLYNDALKSINKTHESATDNEKWAAELYVNDTEGRYDDVYDALDAINTYLETKQLEKSVMEKFAYEAGTMTDKQYGAVYYIVNVAQTADRLLNLQDAYYEQEIDSFKQEAEAWGEKFAEALGIYDTNHNRASDIQIWAAELYANDTGDKYPTPQKAISAVYASLASQAGYSGNTSEAFSGLSSRLDTIPLYGPDPDIKGTISRAGFTIAKNTILQTRYNDALKSIGKTHESATDNEKWAAELYANDTENKYSKPQDALDAVYEYLANQAGYSGNTSEAFSGLSSRLDSIPLYGADPDTKGIISEAGLEMANDIFLQTLYNDALKSINKTHESATDDEKWAAELTIDGTFGSMADAVRGVNNYRLVEDVLKQNNIAIIDADKAQKQAAQLVVNNDYTSLDEASAAVKAYQGVKDILASNNIDIVDATNENAVCATLVQAGLYSDLTSAKEGLDHYQRIESILNASGVNLEIASYEQKYAAQLVYRGMFNDLDTALAAIANNNKMSSLLKANNIDIAKASNNHLLAGQMTIDGLFNNFDEALGALGYFQKLEALLKEEGIDISDAGNDQILAAKAVENKIFGSVNEGLEKIGNYRRIQEILSGAGIDIKSANDKQIGAALRVAEGHSSDFDMALSDIENGLSLTRKFNEVDLGRCKDVDDYFAAFGDRKTDQLSSVLNKAPRFSGIAQEGSLNSFWAAVIEEEAFKALGTTAEKATSAEKLAVQFFLDGYFTDVNQAYAAVEVYKDNKGVMISMSITVTYKDDNVKQKFTYDNKDRIINTTTTQDKTATQDKTIIVSTDIFYKNGTNIIASKKTTRTIDGFMDYAEEISDIVYDQFNRIKSQTITTTTYSKDDRGQIKETVSKRYIYGIDYDAQNRVISQTTAVEITGRMPNGTEITLRNLEIASDIVYDGDAVATQTLTRKTYSLNEKDEFICDEKGIPLLSTVTSDQEIADYNTMIDGLSEQFTALGVVKDTKGNFAAADIARAQLLKAKWGSLEAVKELTDPQGTLDAAIADYDAMIDGLSEQFTALGVVKDTKGNFAAADIARAQLLKAKWGSLEA
ncbi:MAG: hypothetical protein PHV77_02590, partial [Candidatus Omnitrophica bacterium]|nr:hypothetical protein [Candidatus Omnitrophota bacterium]